MDTVKAIGITLILCGAVAIWLLLGWCVCYVVRFILGTPPEPMDPIEQANAAYYDTVVKGLNR